MDILRIETFLTIVKAKSISKAADALFVSQATVSQRLNALEEEVGFPLLERSKGIRSIKLTPRGEQFILIAHKWMDLFNDMECQIAAEQKLPLAIGCTESMNIHLFSPFYKSLIRGEKGNAFDLTLRTERSTEIHKMIENRELDIGFVYSLHPNNNILITPFFFEPLFVIALSGDAEDARTEYHPSELDPRYEIYTNWSSDFQAWHQNFWNSFVSPYMVLDSEYTIIDYLDSEALWAIVPKSVAVLSKKSNPDIKVYKLLEKPPARVCYKVSHKLPKESRKNSLALFSNLMVEYIADQTDLSLFD
jgi:DNA-binding transcriptional LysR family regulator